MKLIVRLDGRPAAPFIAHSTVRRVKAERDYDRRRFLSSLRLFFFFSLVPSQHKRANQRTETRLRELTRESNATHEEPVSLFDDRASQLTCFYIFSRLIERHNESPRVRNEDLLQRRLRCGLWKLTAWKFIHLPGHKPPAARRKEFSEPTKACGLRCRASRRVSLARRPQIGSPHHVCNGVMGWPRQTKVHLHTKTHSYGIVQYSMEDASQVKKQASF